MRLTQVMMDVRDMIARSDEVRAFCMEKFGKPPTIMAGYNARRPPVDDELPTVILIPDKSDFDMGGKGEHRVVMTWAVSNGLVERENNLVTFPGFLQVDELGELLIAALEPVGSQYRITYTGYDLHSSEQAPAFVGEIELAIAEW